MSNDLNIALKIKTAVDGLSEVNKLVHEIDTLGGNAIEVADEAKKLGSEIDKLSRQQSLIDQFRKTKDQLQQTDKAMADAKQRAAELGRELSVTEQPTKKLAAEFERARQSARELSEQSQAQRLALQTLRTTLDDAGISSKNLAQQQIDVNRRLNESSSAVAGLRGSLVDTKQRLTDVASSSGNAEIGLGGVANAANSAGSGMKKAHASAIDLATGLKAAATGAAAVALWQTNASAESLQKTLELLTGSQAAAAREMDYVRAVANRLGIEVGVAGKSYVQLAAAAKDTELEGNASRAIWESVSNAMARLGKTAPETEGALLAISQMMSKGTISAEELRGQLGERMPGAFNVAAKAMDVTTAELGKLLENGEIAATDFLPKFARELNSTFAGGPIDAANSSLGRLSNSINATLLAAGDTGAFKAMRAGIEWLGEGFKYATLGVVTFGESIRAIGQSYDAFVARVKGMNFKGFGDEIKTIFAEAQLRADAAEKKIFAVDDSLKQAAETAKNAGDVLAQAADKPKAGFDALGKSIKDAIANLDKAPGSAEKLKAVFDAIFDQKISGQATLGFEAIGTAIDHLRGKSQQTDEAIRSGLSESLKSLSADKLVAFEAAAKSAFDNGSLNAKNYGAVLDGVVGAAFARLNVDADRFTDGISKAGNESLASFTVIANSSKAGADAIAAAFNAALAKIDTKQGLDQLTAKIIQLGKDGKLTGSQVKEALTQIDIHAKSLAGDGLNKVEQAFARLGISSKGKLKELADQAKVDFDTIRNSGTASTEDIKAAFISYAEKSIKANGGVISTQLEMTALFVGAQKELEALGNKGVETGDKIKTGLATAGDESERLRKRIKELENRSSDSVVSVAQSMGGVAVIISDSLRYLNDNYADLMGSLSGTSRNTHMFIRQAEAAVQVIGDLDDSRLDNLKAAIQGAKDRLDAMRESAKSTVDSLRDDIDRLKGNEAAIQEREFRRRYEDLKKQLSDAGKAGDMQAVAMLRESIALLKQKFELENNREVIVSTQKSGGGAFVGSTESTDIRFGQAQAGTGANTPSAPPPTQVGAPVKTINLNLNVGGRTMSLPVLDSYEADVERFISVLAEHGMRAN